MMLRRSLLAVALTAAVGLVHAADPSPATSLAPTAAAAPPVPTAQLPRTVVPSLVQLELRLDPKQPRFGGTTRIHADVAQSTDVVWMHGAGLDIKQAHAVVGGKRIALKSEDADVSGVLKLSAAKPLPAGRVLIEIGFEAPFGALQGAYRVKPDGRDYVVTQMEPLGARRTFPGFDEPSFKQPWEITLVVPEADVAVANTRELKTEKLAGGWKKVTFARTEALPSYLIAFAVGPWDIAEGPDIAPHGSRTAPIPFRGLAAQGQGKRMRYSNQHTPAIMHALEDYFGSPYPFDKLDNVAAPDFAAGAMENPGLIVYRDSLMFPDENSAVSQRQSYWSISAHELAHQWFGNLVTMKWWDDLWLNEAFATWMAAKITDQLQPQFHANRNLLQSALGAMASDSLASTRVIHQPIENFTDIQAAFDGITYSKGGAVLSMFENYIGEIPFRDGVRKYLKDHARGNATSTDLIDALAANSPDAAGLKAAFLSFIDQPGVPFVQVDVDCAQGKTPSLTLQQQRYLPLGSTASATQSWGIPMCVRYADGKDTRQQCGLVSGAQSRLELKEARSCPSWVMPNANGAGYYRFALAPKLQQSLSQAFAQLNEREQRVYADSVTAAYGAGKLTPSQLLAALPQFTTSKVRQTVTAGSGDIDWMANYLIDDDRTRGKFRAQVAQIYRPRLQQLGMTPRDGEADGDRLLRTSLIGLLAEDLHDPALRAEMGRHGRRVLGLDGDGSLSPDAVPRDLRSTAITVAVQDGGATAFDTALKHLRSTQDPMLRSQLVGALGSVTDPVLAGRARALALESGLLRRNELFALLASHVSQPENRAATRPWVDSQFDALAERVAPGGSNLLWLYTAGMCDASAVADIEQRFGARLKDMEGGPMELKQVSESIRLCSAARAARRGLPLQVAGR